MNVIPSKCHYPVVKHAILESILCLGHSPEVGANQSESASLWTEAPNSIWRTDLLLRHLLVDPVLVMTSTMKLMMWNRPASCHVCDLRDLRLKVSRGVVLCEELFDMLDVEEKGTLTQTEFADGLLHLLTPLGFLDTTKSTNAGLGPFCPSRWGFSSTDSTSCFLLTWVNGRFMIDVLHVFGYGFWLDT